MRKRQSIVTKRESSAMLPEEILEKFKNEIIESTRKRIAMRKYFKGFLIRFRRMATTGPNQGYYSVFAKAPGKPPISQIVDIGSIQLLADGVTDEEVFAELDKTIQNDSD